MKRTIYKNFLFQNINDEIFVIVLPKQFSLSDIENIAIDNENKKLSFELLLENDVKKYDFKIKDFFSKSDNHKKKIIILDVEQLKEKEENQLFYLIEI